MGKSLIQAGAAHYIICFDVCTGPAASPCCPVACGPLCCSRTDTCLNTGIGNCCSQGTFGCNGQTCCDVGDICMRDNRCCPNTTENPHQECDGTLGSSCCKISDHCLTTGACCSNTTCVNAAGVPNSVCCAPGQGCFAPTDAQPQQCLECDATTQGQACGTRCCNTSFEQCTNFEGSQCCSNKAACKPPNEGLQCCPAGQDCAHVPGKDQCCATESTCDDPPQCCTGQICVKPTGVPQSCCPIEFACGGTACCTDPTGFPCTRGFPGVTGSECCALRNVCNHTDKKGNLIEKQCCDLGTSCMVFPDSHHQCCERDWVCGETCCSPTEGTCVATRNGPVCVAHGP